MAATKAFERRDPCSPVLALGTILGRIRGTRDTGWVEVKDQGKSHGIQIQNGAVTDVVTDNIKNDLSTIHERAARLFSLSRPQVVWIPEKSTVVSPPLADPAKIVLSGMVARLDLFDPCQLAMRIPVPSLRVSQELLPALRRLPFSRHEIEFLSQLNIPTPIPMILWKRGMEPRHAGALILALNVLGLWQGIWEPGVLPRRSTALRVNQLLINGVSDHDLLGVDEDQEPRDVERAFRRLAMELHPDRMGDAPAAEVAISSAAFAGIKAAYERLRQKSRRRRPVRSDSAATLGKVDLVQMRPDNWASMLEQARREKDAGNIKSARNYAMKALSLSPPPGAVRELTLIIKAA